MRIETAYMVGDHPRDMAAAMHAGCRTIFVTGHETPLPRERPNTFLVARDLLAASQLIIEQLLVGVSLTPLTAGYAVERDGQDLRSHALESFNDHRLRSSGH